MLQTTFWTVCLQFAPTAVRKRHQWTQLAVFWYISRSQWFKNSLFRDGIEINKRARAVYVTIPRAPEYYRDLSYMREREGLKIGQLGLPKVCFTLVFTS